jgi:hypothetical protein
MESPTQTTEMENLQEVAQNPQSPNYSSPRTGTTDRAKKSGIAAEAQEKVYR